MNFFRSKPTCDVLPPLPDELQLQLAPGESRQFALSTDEDCEVQWHISQLNPGTQRLSAGAIQTLAFTLPATAQPHSLIRGQLRLVRGADGALVRVIHVAGWVRKPRTEKHHGTESPPLPRHWWRWLLALLAAGLGAVGMAHFFRSPALVVKPAHMNLGTLWYSPPVGGNIDTAMVFTVQWRVPPRNADAASLVARTSVHYTSETGQENLLEETTEFPFSHDLTEARVPLRCYDLSNETVRVNGTISLTVSNVPMRVSPVQIQFEARFKPALR